MIDTCDMTNGVTLGQASRTIWCLMKVNEAHRDSKTHLYALIVVKTDNFWCDALRLLVERALSVRHLLRKEWCAEIKLTTYLTSDELTDSRIGQQ